MKKLTQKQKTIEDAKAIKLDVYSVINFLRADKDAKIINYINKYVLHALDDLINKIK